MPSPDPALLETLLSRIRVGLTAQTARPLVVGICGAQGSGKSTLVAALAERLMDEGIAVATLSLDDLYLTRGERLRLASEVHLLFATRGVPGTHDIALGLGVLDALVRGEAAPLPRFDKALDERLPPAAWPSAPADTQVVLLEGWCLGARAQSAEALAAPVNPLEQREDPAAIWRGHANAALSGPYRQLFARVDQLVLLAAPSWEVVAHWREQQEAELRERASGAMTPLQVRRFIQHYERLTRWILEEMPGRVDLTVRLDAARRMTGQCGEPSLSW